MLLTVSDDEVAPSMLRLLLDSDDVSDDESLTVSAVFCSLLAIAVHLTNCRSEFPTDAGCIYGHDSSRDFHTRIDRLVTEKPGQ